VPQFDNKSELKLPFDCGNFGDDVSIDVTLKKGWSTLLKNLCYGECLGFFSMQDFFLYGHTCFCAV
jgi:hypothetical protein